MKDKFRDIFTYRYGRMMCSKGAQSKSTAAVDPQHMVQILTSINMFIFRQLTAHGQIGNTDKIVIFRPPLPPGEEVKYRLPYNSFLFACGH